MKSTRRMLCLVLCLVMCLALFPASASAAGIIASGDANTAGTAVFKLYSDGKLVISGTGQVSRMDQWSFSSLGGGDYASAQDAVLQTRSEIRSLIIEEGITSIGTYAFWECPNLKEVSLPVSLTTIWSSAFQNCSGLVSIMIPSNVQRISSNAFQGCTGLTSVYLSDGLQQIDEGAFLDCAALPEITIPANVTTIGSQAFANCNSLKTIVFIGNYPTGMSADTFQNVKADAYYPVDNESWNQFFETALDTDFGGRLTWKASAVETSNNGWVRKGKDTAGRDIWYYYQNGIMVRDNWVAYNDFWFYFDENGRMVNDGHHLINGKYYYLQPGTGIRLSGWQDGRFYDDDGVWQPSYSGVDDSTWINKTCTGFGINYFVNGWQELENPSGTESFWFFIKNKAKVKGWMKWGDYWYYMDPTTGAMVTGWLTWNGNTYYLRDKVLATADGIPDKVGSMVAGRTEWIGNAAGTVGAYYTFDASGALKGGKMDDNPMGLATGFREGLDANGKSGGGWYFYRSDGTMVKNGWELVGSYWYYFDNNGKMKTGWLKWNNDWYYLTPKTGTGSPVTSATGRMATGFCPGIMKTPDGVALPSPGKTYFFKSNGALNGKGWIQYNKKWHYLQDDGTVKTGWFREGTKWYYLRDDTNPIGEMVTGVFDVPTTLADGTPNTPNGTQSFKANGEWIGAGDQIVAGIAGKWGKDSNGKWHWYDANGNSVTGWQLIDNKWYYLSPSSTPVGVMVTGFQNIDGDCFYFKPDGALQAGWQLVDGVWYYFNPNHDGNYGAMRKGWQEINGEWYYLDPTTGACQTGWIENPAGSDTWYYLNTANEGTYGAMHHGGWMKLGNKWYYLNPKADGYYGRQIQGWVTDGGQKYYMQKSGNPAEAWMLTGRVVGITEWQTDTGSYNYYFDPDGHMVTNADRGGYHYGPDGKET